MGLGPELCLFRIELAVLLLVVGYHLLAFSHGPCLSMSFSFAEAGHVVLIQSGISSVIAKKEGTVTPLLFGRSTG